MPISKGYRKKHYRHQIIEVLALTEVPINPNQIAAKVEGAHYSAIYSTIFGDRGLLNGGIVKIHKTETARTGLKSKFLILSIYGVLDYINSYMAVLGNLKNKQIENLEKIMIGYSHFYEHHLFGIWGVFKKTIDKDQDSRLRLYNMLILSAFFTIGDFPFEIWYYTADKSDLKNLFIEHEGEIMNLFAWHFFNDHWISLACSEALKRAFYENEEIYNAIYKTYLDRHEWIYDYLDDLNMYAGYYGINNKIELAGKTEEDL